MLNGTPRGAFLRRARRQELGRRPADAGAGRPAMLIPNPFYAAYAAGAIARRLRAGLSAGDRGHGIPARPRRARARTCSRARSLSISPRRRTRRAPSPITPTSSSSPRWRGASASSFCATNAIARSTAISRRRACCEASAPDFANVVVFHSLSKRSNLPGLARRLRRRRPPFPRRLSRTAQRRRAAGADAGPACRHRRL